MREIECIQCHNIFLAENPRQLYCSPECRNTCTNNRIRWKRALKLKAMIVKCGHCGKEFHPATVKTKFCCEECRDAERKAKLKKNNDKYHQLELKEKERKAHINAEIIEINKKAKSMGMNYGQYVAIQTAEMTKIERKW